MKDLTGRLRNGVHFGLLAADPEPCRLCSDPGGDRRSARPFLQRFGGKAQLTRRHFKMADRAALMLAISSWVC